MEAPDDQSPTAAETNTIYANAGDDFTISLDANHTTGYSWGLAAPLDPTVLELKQTDYATDPHPVGMVGVGGHETWIFTALAPGSTTITLNYRRPWEPDDPAESKSFSVEIVQVS